MSSRVGGTRGGCEAVTHHRRADGATFASSFARPTAPRHFTSVSAIKPRCSRCVRVQHAPASHASSAATPSTSSSSSTHPFYRAPHTSRKVAALGQGSVQRRPSRLGAGGMDVMPAWTLDQIAGLVFGGIMLASVTSASQLDVFVAQAQRRQLGLCEQCGGVNQPATCKQSNCPMKSPASKQQ